MKLKLLPHFAHGSFTKSNLDRFLLKGNLTNIPAWPQLTS